MKTKLVLFDLYKTLIHIWLEEKDIDVWRQIALFLRYKDIHLSAEKLRDDFFANIDLAYQTRRKIEIYPEIDMVQVLRMALAEQQQVIGDGFLIDLLQLFRALCTRGFGVFDDSHPTLEYLKANYKIGLVTNAHRVFAEPELKMVNLYTHWDVLVMSSDHGISKPDPNLFFIALEQLNLTPDDAIYVGDSIEHDVIGAQSAGMKVVHINREGQQNSHLNAVPDWTFTRLGQVIDILN